MAHKRPTEGEYPDESRKRIQNPHKHRGGRERSEKKRKMFQQQGRLTMQEEEDLIAVQMAELNESPEVKNRIAAVLRNAYLEKYGSEPGPSGSKGPAKPASESESANDDVDQTDSSIARLEEQFGQDLEIEPELQEEMRSMSLRRRIVRKRSLRGRIVRERSSRRNNSRRRSSKGRFVRLGNEIQRRKTRSQGQLQGLQLHHNNQQTHLIGFNLMEL